MSTEAALKHYKSQLEASRKYYETHKDEVKEKMRQRYREKNPNPKPIGRPRKETVAPPPSIPKVRGRPRKTV